MPRGRRRRWVGVCTACRQNKVHCTSEETFPQPCSRCESKGLRCTIDSSFKRTPARQKAKEEAAELERLRRQRANGNLSPVSHDNTLTQQSVDSGTDDVSPKEAIELSSFEPFKATLESNTFNNDDIPDRFQIFVEHFHHYLPIVSLPLQITALHKHSPLLFWTVVVISSRFRPLPKPQQTALETEYTAMVQRTSQVTPMTLHTIQALLLICTWPIPVLYQFSDPSSLYLHTALGGCGFLNLNRPANKHVYQGCQLTNAHLQAMSRTWLAVFCVSTRLEGWWGTPTLVKHAADLANVEAHLNKRGTPPQLAAEAALLVVVAKHNSLTSTRLDGPAQEALTDLHITDIDAVARRFGPVWSEHLQSTALASKLQLEVSYITSRRRDPGLRMDNAALTSHLIAIKSFAVQLIGIFDTLVQETPSEDQLSPPKKYMGLPKSYHRSVTYAAFCLLKFCCSNQALREQDRAQSRKSVSVVRDALMRSSSRVGGSGVGDEPSRASLVIDLLLRHTEGETVDEDTRIDDRGGSSVMWDSLRKAYQLRGRPTNRTDLLEFIDPTHAADDPACAVDETGLSGLFADQIDDAADLNNPLSEDFFSNAFQQLPDFDWLDSSIWPE